MFSKIKNGYLVFHLDVSLKDTGFCSDILNILWRENFIRGYHKLSTGALKVFLKYHEGSPVCTRLIVLSKPRDRLYASAIDLSRFDSTLGVLIVSTPRGLMSSKKAVALGVGGEVLAFLS